MSRKISFNYSSGKETSNASRRGNGRFVSWPALSFAFLIFILLAGATASYAADITYTGNEELGYLPSWTANGGVGSFFSLTPSGNNVMVNYVPSLPNINPGYVYGGLDEHGAVVNNNVILINGHIEGSVYGGGSYSGNVSNDKVTISGGIVGDKVYGGSTRSGLAGYNNVTISGGAISGDVYSGYSRNGNAVNNSLDASGGYMERAAYAGYSAYGDAVNNTANIGGGAYFHQVVYGGYSTDGVASGNVANVTGGEVRYHVYGGIVLTETPSITISISAGAS